MLDTVTPEVGHAPTVRRTPSHSAPWSQAHRHPAPAPERAECRPAVPSGAASCGGKSVLVAFEAEETRESVAELVTRWAETEALICDRAELCRAALQEQKVNAVLLDMALPGQAGFELCAELREERFRPPILLFGQCQEDRTAIAALESGATDYLCLPFNPAVFLARLRAHLRHHEESDFVVYKVGPFDFAPGDRLLLERETGRKLRLTGIETRLMRALLQQPGAFADRDDLMRELWGVCNARTSHAIDSHIYRMRQKIEPDPKAPERLVTEGRAYRLVL